LKNYKNATGGACGTRAVTVGGGEISVQPMVDPSRSDFEDSDGGGLDVR
jgi:hypothetical protein